MSAPATLTSFFQFIQAKYPHLLKCHNHLRAMASPIKLVDFDGFVHFFANANPDIRWHSYADVAKFIMDTYGTEDTRVLIITSDCRNAPHAARAEMPARRKAPFVPVTNTPGKMPPWINVVNHPESRYMTALHVLTALCNMDSSTCTVLAYLPSGVFMTNNGYTEARLQQTPIRRRFDVKTPMEQSSVFREGDVAAAMMLRWVYDHSGLVEPEDTAVIAVNVDSDYILTFAGVGVNVYWLLPQTVKLVSPLKTKNKWFFHISGFYHSMTPDAFTGFGIMTLYTGSDYIVNKDYKDGLVATKVHEAILQGEFSECFHQPSLDIPVVQLHATKFLRVVQKYAQQQGPELDARLRQAINCFLYYTGTLAEVPARATVLQYPAMLPSPKSASFPSTPVVFQYDHRTSHQPFAYFAVVTSHNKIRRISRITAKTFAKALDHTDDIMHTADASLTIVNAWHDGQRFGVHNNIVVPDVSGDLVVCDEQLVVKPDDNIMEVDEDDVMMVS